MFAEYLDRFTNNGLVEVAFGVDGVAIEGEGGESQARDGEIGEAFKRPAQRFQHLILS